MDVKRFYYEPNAQVELNMKPILRNIIIGLDEFIDFVKAKYPVDFDKYQSSLRLEYVELIRREKSSSYDGHVDKLVAEYENMEPPLKTMDFGFLKLSIVAFLSLLKFEKYLGQFNHNKAKWDATDLIRAMNVFDYYQVASLLSILLKKEAIQAVSEFIVNKLEERRDPENYDKSVEALIERFSPGYEQWRSQEVAIKVDENKRVIMRVSKCKWAEVMEGLDKDLAHAMICNTDFKNATIFNEEFILTRTQTLMQGAEYCDFCYHDKRYDNDLTHPPKQVFEDLIGS
jgi:hypothetical protein